ncbi:hypothetical protein AJ79_07196 [Helicocarpus griseus UAMH5409]|uniref:DUF647 domain-containing protein n=1 Tax=Helicocarpus griseus UAMH5409 TaxID=1447875 RepID=A0A2B7X4V9_9EURO|nr:hypothetical protein AJ79_07196 [Helicocarpus griseus UAMH5409]
MPPNDAITIRETNEMGTHKATYIYSATTESLPSTTATPDSGSEGDGRRLKRRRVDLVPPSHEESSSYFASLLNVFLPVGYPHSDSLQAFSSSIAGLLASRSVLQGVGVGDASASPTVALLHSVLQESMGRIATILFAHRLGTSLGPECKMYRLAADVLNDAAMIFDCLSPVFPKHLRVVVLSLSSVLRALCGVAAGSSKASLSSHFAKWGNLGELNAKDSSQETIISLLGMLCGSLVVSQISSPFTTWLTLLSLLLIHISTNYAAVRAVNMTTLNRQRANIVFSTIFEEDRVLTPSQASKYERIFERDGVLRWRASSTKLGSCRIGAPFQELLLNGSSCKVSSFRDVPRLLRLFEKEEYILWFDPVSKRGIIVLKNDVTPMSQLKAWSHALMVSRGVTVATTDDESRKRNGDNLLEKEKGEKLKLLVQREQEGNGMLLLLENTLQTLSANFQGQIARLRRAGWDVDTPSLETRPGRRFEILK